MNENETKITVRNTEIGAEIWTQRCFVVSLERAKNRVTYCIMKAAVC